MPNIANFKTTQLVERAVTAHRSCIINATGLVAQSFTSNVVSRNLLSSLVMVSRKHTV